MSVERISIDLERSDGVYYAGEVVRGTVKLETVGSVLCRGFHLKFIGQSHWHIGRGEDLLDGTTMFQEQHQTCVGGFHRTGVLDNAGSDANFDTIHNIGIVTLPCDSYEDLNLILRVMDYDWLKKDDLLGEIQINAFELLGQKSTNSKRTKQTFTLTRNGKPTAGEVTLSAKVVPFNSIYPTRSRCGKSLSKNFQKKFCFILRVHEATGLQKADLFGQNDVYVQVYETKKTIKPGQALPKPIEKLRLPHAKENIYPFSFQLSNDAPGSAELRLGNWSYVRYHVHAEVDFAMRRDPYSKRVITVLPNRPLPSLSLLGPCTKEVMDEPLYGCNIFSLKCCKTDGPVSLKLCVDRRAYAPGEEVNVSGTTITNDSNSKLEATFKLQLMARLNTYKHSLSDGHKYEMATISIKPNSTLKIDAENVLRIWIPAVYPSFYGGVQCKPTRNHYPCLEWTYSLVLSVRQEGNNSSSTVDVHIPILISATPSYVQAIKRASVSTRLSKVDMDDPWMIFEHTNVGPKSCDTGPTIGPKNCGRIVEVGKQSMIEAGGTNFVGLEKHMSFTPMIQTFWSPDDSKTSNHCNRSSTTLDTATSHSTATYSTN